MMELIVLKINDIDISYVQKNEALKMFLNIEEPFLLEVRRKTSGTEIDITEGLEALQLYKSKEEDLGKCKDSINQIVLSIQNTITSLSRQTQTEDIDDFSLEQLAHGNVNKIVEEEHNIFEQCLEPEIDIEEITLRKSNSNEHLGLTVCYSPICGTNGTILNNNIGSKLPEDLDQCAEVYISDIHPNSVAGRDGRLRPGDQILQINGKDIKNKDDTEALIAENNNAVTLLVSRYLYGDDEYFNEHCSGPEVMNDEQEVDTYDVDINNALCDVHSYLTYENNIVTNKSANSLDMPIFSELNSSKSNYKEWKGSGEIPITLKEEKTNQSSSDGIHFEEQLHTLKEKELNVNHKECLKETEHIYETIPEYSDNEPFYSSPYEFSSTISKNVSNFKSSSTTILQESKSPEQKQRVAQWLGIKNHVCGRFLPKPKEILNSNFLKTGIAINIVPSNACSSNSTISAAACSNITTKLNFSDDHDNSSSAYNSGGSNNSVIPCNMPVQIVDSQFQPISSDTMRQSGKDNLYTNKKSKETNQLCKVKALTNLKAQMHHPSSTKMFTTACNNLIPHKSVSIDSSHNKIEPQQFTAPNLSQYRFVSSQQVSSIFNSTNVNDAVSHSLDTHQEQMVWKVKRRADGSRYIVRRPVRKYILKERTFRLNGLPCDGTTTEDDTVSEVKLGRYWSKEDRKKHIERAKERRQQSRNTETILKPSFRKRPSKNISGDPNNSHIVDLPINSFTMNQPRFFKLQFNSKNHSSEKLPKNKETTPLNSVDIDIENKIFTESLRDTEKNSANLSITHS